MTPGSPEWRKLITASKVAAILGISPWQSPYALWQEMKGNVEPEPGNDDYTRRGHYLEDGVLAWWRDQHPELSHFHDQPTFALGDWAAATPDAVVGEDAPPPLALVEAKTAAYDDDWGDPGTDAIPDYYYAQCLWQMHVSNIHTCYVAVLTSRLRFAEYVITYDPEQGAALEKRAREFYDSLSADEPPPLDDTVATFNAVRKLHPQIEKGSEVELTEGQARELVELQAQSKALEPALRYAKAVVIDRIGCANYATWQGVRIARRQPRGDDVTFVVTAKPSDLATEGSDAA